MSSMRSTLSRNGMLTLADQGFTSATSFFTSVIIGRVCSKDELGLYALGFSIIVFLAGVQESVITTPYTVFIPRLSGEEERYYKGSMLLLQLAFTLLFVLILLTVIPFSSFTFKPAGLNAILWGLAMASTPVLLREYTRRVNFAHLLMKETLMFDLKVGAIQMGGLLLLAFFGLLSAVHALCMLGVACGIASGMWLIKTRRNYVFKTAHFRSSFRQNWVFGRWLVAATGTSLMSNQFSLWFLTIFHGPANTGILSACQGVIFLSNPFFLGVKNLLGPKMSHIYANGDFIKLNRLIVKVTLLLAFVMGGFCLLLFLWGENFVVGFYGSKYAGFGRVISILAVGTFVYALATPLAFGISLAGRPDLNFKADLVILAISLSLGLYLIRELGAVGVAYGFLINNIVSLPLRYVIFKRYINGISPCAP